MENFLFFLENKYLCFGELYTPEGYSVTY